MTTILVGVLAALLSFGFIVFIHEMGHFLAARWAGIRCPVFAIGFGPKLIAFPWLGSEFSLRLFPIGGYVLMVGEDPNLDGADGWHKQFIECVGEVNFPTTAGSVLQNVSRRDPVVEAFLKTLPPQRVYHDMLDLEGNFNAKTAWQRTVVILGGVTMNFLAAILILLGLGFTAGLASVEPSIQARAQKVSPDSPAHSAGMKDGDSLLKIDGISILNGEDFKAQMANRVGESVTITVQARGSQPRNIKVIPDLMMGAGYQFRKVQGVQLVAVQPDVKLPANIKLPYEVTQVNGSPLKDLLELRGWGQNAKELNLTGPQGPLKLEATPNFHPRAIVGIMLASVTTFGFEKVATNEVIEVRGGTQAARAGIKKGDKLIYLQGVPVYSGKTRLESCLARLAERPASGADSLRLIVERANQEKELVMDEVPEPTAEGWGIKLQPVDTRQVALSTKFIMGKVVSIPMMIGRGLLNDTKATVKSLGEETTGPIGIMQQIFEVSDEGLPSLLLLVAILNAFIATFNLLPIPALDGSRCLFIWLGALRGRALNPDKEARIHFVGILLLLCVVALVSLRDVHRLYQGVHILK